MNNAITLPIIIGEAENLGSHAIYLEWENENGETEWVQGDFDYRYFEKGEHPKTSTGNKYHGNHKWINHIVTDENGEPIAEVWAQLF